MKGYFLAIYLAFVNILNTSLIYSYPINIGPHSISKFGNYNNGNVCILMFICTSFWLSQLYKKNSPEPLL